jgi:hypothetical protein
MIHTAIFRTCHRIHSPVNPVVVTSRLEVVLPSTTVVPVQPKNPSGLHTAQQFCIDPLAPHSVCLNGLFLTFH